MTKNRVTDIRSVERAKEIARKTLDGECDPLLACRNLADLRACLPSVSDDVLDAFVAVASEVDDLPIGGEREYWALDALRAKDIEAENYRERVKAAVREALQRLLNELGNSNGNRVGVKKRLSANLCK